MKNSQYLTLLYMLTTICLCVIVYIVADYQNTLGSSTSHDSYVYWEEVSTDSQYDSGNYQIISSDYTKQNEAPINQTQNPNVKITSTGEIYYQTPEDPTASIVQSKEEVASVAQEPQPSSSKQASSKKQEYTGIVNINTASFEQLCSLNGIGEVLAQRIIDYRKSHGGFKTIEEIKNVSGIGEKRFASIKDRITV